MAPRTGLIRSAAAAARAAGPALQRPTGHRGLDLQSTIGNRATVALLSAGQAKLAVGNASDQLEIEADAVADTVTRDLDTPVVSRSEASEEEEEEPLQRSEAPELEEEEPLQRSEASEEEEEEPLQRAAAAPIGPEGGNVAASTESTINAARNGGGSPLPDRLRGSFERAFGADFEGVRVHRGKQSEALNREVGARAFTVGSDIFLGPRAPQAESSEGKHLLAHELTHTIQQGASRTRREQR